MSEITVFKSPRIRPVTMDANRPNTSHVAVRDGMILAVGGADCADAWGASTLDTRLADAVLMPGFVEGHAHMMAGSVWNYAYAGYHDRIDPDGKMWRGMGEIGQVIARLSEYQQGLGADEPLIGWGLIRFSCPSSPAQIQTGGSWVAVTRTGRALPPINRLERVLFPAENSPISAIRGFL